MVEEHDAVEVTGSLVEVMCSDHHGDVFLLEAVKQVKDAFLRRRIETGQRLVHQHQLGFLGEGAGDEHALLLSAGELTDLTLSQIGDVHRFERVLDVFPIPFVRPVERTEFGGASHHDHVGDGDGEVPIHLRALRNVADAHMPARASSRRPLPRPTLGGNTPATTLKRVLLPAPFGPTTATRSPACR
ncbi:MAG: hypothetical protein MZV64_00180 [Ignavibacteriales bacterium]|nr:hypothetical protein [Ignavibacteriales bacterium]